LSGDVNLDVTHQELLRFELRAPDVLILPSKLKHFAKVGRGQMNSVFRGDLPLIR